MPNIHMGFLTNNAGEDIPGSTIKWTIENYSKFFLSTIVVDGRLTNQAKEYYWERGITYIDSPWTGKHVDQYIKRNQAIAYGDWILALDCDEAPSNDLVRFIVSDLSNIDRSGYNIIYIPVESWWSKNDSNEYFKCEIFENRPDYFRKPILYKNLPGSSFITDMKLGTHVTPYQANPSGLATTATYNHFKSPETIIFNAAVVMMEDLRNPNRPLGLSNNELNELEYIGKKYNILNGPGFRRITKQHKWPEELKILVKKFARRETFCKALYLLYFIIENAEIDEDNKDIQNYEYACSSYGYNRTYNNSKKSQDRLIIPHTSCRLTDPDLPVGAG